MIKERRMCVCVCVCSHELRAHPLLRCQSGLKVTLCRTNMCLWEFINKKEKCVFLKFYEAFVCVLVFLSHAPERQEQEKSPHQTPRPQYFHSIKERGKIPTSEVHGYRRRTQAFCCGYPPGGWKEGVGVSSVCKGMDLMLFQTDKDICFEKKKKKLTSASASLVQMLPSAVVYLSGVLRCCWHSWWGVMRPQALGKTLFLKIILTCCCVWQMWDIYIWLRRMQVWNKFTGESVNHSFGAEKV